MPSIIVSTGPLNNVSSKYQICISEVTEQATTSTESIKKSRQSGSSYWTIVAEMMFLEAINKLS